MGSNTQFLSLKEEGKPKEDGGGEEIDMSNFYVAYNAELCIQTQISTVNIMDRVFHHQA